jgi:hypothetical protein
VRLHAFVTARVSSSRGHAHLHFRLVFAVLVLVACKGAERPRVPPAADQTVAVTRDGWALRGVAGDGTLAYSALAAASAPASVVEARRGPTVAWQAELAGEAGEVAIAGGLLAVAVRATAHEAGDSLELRGDPGAVVIALDRTSGAMRWRLALDSNQWVLVTSLAGLGDDLVVGGSFAGTLRIGARVVTSAGGSDGFVARITASGALGWLVRTGGAGTDAVQGVATGGSEKARRIAIAGTFSSGAELLGVALPSLEERSPFGDAFVAELDGTGARRWSATFGGRADDAVAGVAIDDRGRVAVAVSGRDVIRIGSAMAVTHGASDGVVVWFSDDGEIGAWTTIGGPDFDGLRAIAPLGNHVVVAGFFSGVMKLADRELAAGGGDDAFLAAVDANGAIARVWHVGGPGREEITSIGSVPGGFIAGVAHTAGATIEGSSVPAPGDPASGAAIAIRGF